MIKRGVPVTVILGGALLMAGCGSGPSDNGVASKSPTQIYAAARKATVGASSVRYSGHVDAGGKAVSLDIAAAGKRGGGTVTVQGATLDIVVSGTTLYLKGTAAAWTALGAGAAAGSLVADKWLKTSTTNKDFSGFSSFTNVSNLLSSASPTQKARKGKLTTFDGQSAITLTAPGKGVLLVATTGKPYILEIKGTQPGDSGAVIFSGYDATNPPAIPAHSVDLNSLIGSG